MDGIIKAVCISKEKGTPKSDIGQCELIEDYGLENDAHAGKWHRQVSLLSWDKVEEYRNSFGDNYNEIIKDGAFGENLLVAGIDVAKLPLGTAIYAGDAVLEITQVGKECHSGCVIAKTTGKCIMPTEGVFARVITGGIVKTGDSVKIEYPKTENI